MMINTNSRKFAVLALTLAAAAGAASGGAGAAAAPAADLVKQMTAAEAAKAVRRPIIEMVDGKDENGNEVKVPKIVRHVAVKESEVFGFKDYGTHVVVVTEDGQKFSSLDTPSK